MEQSGLFWAGVKWAGVSWAGVNWAGMNRVATNRAGVNWAGGAWLEVETWRARWSWETGAESGSREGGVFRTGVEWGMGGAYSPTSGSDAVEPS